MGIPSYFVHIVKNHRSIIKEYNNESTKIDNLYLDCNSLIYDAIANIVYKNPTNFEIELLKAICLKLENYINIIKPSKKIFIAFDGIAPVAKLNQQKNRRYKSWFQEEITKSINRTENQAKWNSAAITPGTNFMNKLDKKINEYFQDTKKFNVEEIIISTSKQVGEGEHKLYEYIRTHPEYHKNTSTAIYGLDSDLIMLTLNHLIYSKHLYLFRETPYFIKTLDDSLVANSYYLLDIPEFADKLVVEMIGLQEVDDKIKTHLIQDYVFMCFFLGNDFMPHFSALNIRTNGIDVLLNIYNKINADLKNFYIKDEKIVWKNVRKMVEILAENEYKLLLEEYKIRKKWENRKYQENTEEQRFINTPMYIRTTELLINPYEEGWQHRYYKSLFHIEIDDERRKQISINYLTTLEWTFKYYTKTCPDWRFKYNYNYPPLFQDLIRYIPYLDTEFQEIKEPDPISEYVQLAYVLPRNSLNLLPYKLYNNLLNKFNEYYKLDYNFEWAFCKYFWECHVLIPEIEIKDLENLIKDNS